MKRVVAVFFGILVVSIAIPQVYNLFQPGGDLAGAGSTWNSQVIANNAITTAKINAGAVDLTTKVTGLLPVGNGGIGVGTLTGLAVGNGTSAFSAYGGTSCTNQFPRSLSASGAATCAAVALSTDVSGTLQAAQFPALTSEVTTPGGSLATTITKSISPTWTGNHTFSPASGVGVTVNGVTANYAAILNGANSASGQGLNVAGAFTGAGTTSLVQFSDTGNSNGINFVLKGNGATTPSKTIRVNAGALQVVNDGYSAVIFSMGDNGAVGFGSAAVPAAAGAINATDVQVNAVSVKPLSGTTGSIGGGALIAGQCASGTVAITGSTTSMVALTDPNTYPGDGTIWDAQITSAGTATVKVCAIIALTPTASTYNVRVLQ